MTTTQVKGAGDILNIRAQSFMASKGNNVSEVSFQNVLNGQADKNPGASQTKDSETTQKAGNTQVSEKSKKTDADQRYKANERGASKTAKELDSQQTQSSDSEKLQEAGTEEAMQVLMTAAAGILETAAEVFEIPEEDLQVLMDDLGLSEFSVLDPEQLGSLLLAAGGAEDQAVLLTDGELYTKFQEVMKNLDSVRGADSGVENLSVGELNDYMKVQKESVEEVLPEVKEDAVADAGLEPVYRENVKQAAVPRTRPEEVKTREPENKALKSADTGRTGMADTEMESEDPAVQKLPERPEEGRENRHSGKGAGQNDHAPVFMQRTENVGTAAVNEMTAEAAESTTADTQDIMRQIMDYMRVQVRPETTSLEMQLHPASLGTIHIQLQSRGGVVTANLIAQNETVKAALESQIVQLRENFEEQGVKVEAVEVTVETHQFEQNLEQNNREQNGSESKTDPNRRLRRLNLSEESGDGEDLDEADRIAVQLMEANGSTVDYTA